MGILLRVLLLCYIVSNFCTFGEVRDDGHDIIWCRHCGASVGHASYLFNKLSPGNVKADYEVVFGQNVTVQSLVNPFLFKFDVVTTKKAACVDLGRNSRGDSWFPGYSWRVCTCPGCAYQLGWTFERTLSNDVVDTNQNETFHALILDTLYDKGSPTPVDNLGMTTPMQDLNTTRAPLMPRASESSSSASVSISTSVQPFRPRAIDDQPTSLADSTSTKKDTSTVTTKIENKISTTAANITSTTKI